MPTQPLSTTYADNAATASLSALDAHLAPQAGAWWDGFYADRAKPCAFFQIGPDESLAEWLRSGQLQVGRALDLGCGNGRNALFLARHGFAVDAVDYSATAIAWAREKAKTVSDVTGSATFICASVFDTQFAPQTYDLVYDSGCFHHMAPHRRAPYVALVRAALKPGGWFGLACFRPEGGSGLTDVEVYEQQTLGGGLGYTETQLRAIWTDGSAHFDIHTLRQMQAHPPNSGLFGVPFLWVMLARRL